MNYDGKKIRFSLTFQQQCFMLEENRVIYKIIKERKYEPRVLYPTELSIQQGKRAQKQHITNMQKLRESFFFFLRFIYYFIYFWLSQALVAAAGIFVEACGIFSLQCTVCLGFCLVAVHWLLSSCGTQVFSL